MNSNEIIDFSAAQVSDRAYPNSALRKEPVIFNGEYYLVKYPIRNNKKTHPAQVSSYMNNSISELAGCHIFKSLGIDTQETLIAKRDNLMGVACKDFKGLSSEWYLYEFGDLANRYFSSSELGYIPDMQDVYFVCENHELLRSIKEQAISRYWDTCVIDCLIGNPDRHIGNWGYLYNPNTKETKLAPVYDCGSSLYARIDDNAIQALLANDEEINNLAFKLPRGKVKYQGKNYSYIDLFSNPPYPECELSLQKIVPLINMNNISNIICSTPGITKERAKLLVVVTQRRYDQILCPVYEKILDIQREQEPVNLAAESKDAQVASCEMSLNTYS